MNICDDFCLVRVAAPERALRSEGLLSQSPCMLSPVCLLKLGVQTCPVWSHISHLHHRQPSPGLDHHQLPKAQDKQRPAGAGPRIRTSPSTHTQKKALKKHPSAEDLGILDRISSHQITTGTLDVDTVIKQPASRSYVPQHGSKGQPPNATVGLFVEMGNSCPAVIFSGSEIPSFSKPLGVVCSFAEITFYLFC